MLPLLLGGFVGKQMLQGKNVTGGLVDDKLGQNTFRAGAADPKNYQYGGREGAADEDAGYWRGQGSGAQGRGSVQMDTGLQMGARAEQSKALELQRDAAYGNAPSRAQTLLRQGTDNAINDQMAMAASARGGAGAQAAAQRQAQAGQVAASQNSAVQSAALRADEMARARNDYMSGASGMRQADFGMASQQAQLDFGQRGLNDQYQLGMADREQRIREMQLRGSMGFEGDRRQIDQMNMGANQFNAQQQTSWLDKGMGAISGAGSMLGLSDERAKENIEPLSTREVASHLRSVPSYGYDYKKGVPKELADDSKRAFGPMAQDIAKTGLGASMVVETPAGLAIDLRRAATVGMAADSALQKQIDQLKKELRHAVRNPGR